MKTAFFDTHRFERGTFERINESFGHAITYFEPRLTPETAVLAAGYPAVCVFTNDDVSERTLSFLSERGLRLVALRSAGFNNVDLKAASRLGIRVVRVPAYSPHAVAEHAVGLILALNRRLCRASIRVHEHNFSLDGLKGFDLRGKTVGVVGTGRIGSVFARIMKGFGCEVLAFDKFPDPRLAEGGQLRYVPLDELYSRSDIISLHVPLTEETLYLIDSAALARVKPGVMLINTGRGALIDTRALIGALKSGQVGYAGLDVYEEEENVFFQDVSDRVLQDDVLALLLTLPNVLVTSHQGFLTEEAITQIASTTLSNLKDFEEGKALGNEVKAQT